VGRRPCRDSVTRVPNDQSLIRLAGMLCIEQNDEWLVGRRYLGAESLFELDRTQRDSPSQCQQEVGELQAA